MLPADVDLVGGSCQHRPSCRQRPCRPHAPVGPWRECCGMTTPPRTHVRLNDPGDLVAAVPHLLGFPPADSIVVVAVRAADGMLARLGLSLRADLPAEENQRDLAHLLISPLARSQASGAVLVVVGGGGADPPGLLPHRGLVWVVGEALAAAGIPLLHAVWTADTGGGARWWCYDEL